LADAPVTSVLPSKPAQPSGNPRALWNQPVQTQLLALPSIVAFIWWRWLGFSGWSWLVVLLAIPPSVLYARALDRAGREDESQELPPLPSKHDGE
jgi:ABC-type sugar transport system permease subunit